MPAASASVRLRFDQVRRVAGLAPALPHRLRACIARMPTDPRVCATVILLGVTLGAALALAPSPQPSAMAAKRAEAPAQPPEAPTAPVKMIGAAPRSANCAEQVWPYIEQRCLIRVADRPKASPASGATEPPLGERMTGAASAQPAGPPQGVAAREAATEAVKTRVATARLRPPQSRAGTVLPIPPGAAPIRRADRLSSWRDVGAEDAWADTALESSMLGEPRRRRAHRARHGRFWGGRHGFGFPF